MAERTESSVQIAAPPREVLAVIADFESYPQWAREVREVSVLSREGDGWADQVQFTLDAGVIKDTYVLDYDWDVAGDGTGVVSWDLVRADTLRALHGSYTITADTLPADTLPADTPPADTLPADTLPADGPEGAATQVTYRLAVEVKIPMLGMLRRKAERMIVDTALQSLRRRVESRG